jgi:hypothetical protein
MPRPQRRYPRVPCDVPAELTIDDRNAVHVAIRSLTCDGLGLLVPEPPGGPPSRDERVTVRLTASGHIVTLYGRVAWFQPLRAGRPCNLGVKIDAEPVDPEVADAWADWVVERIAAQHAQSPDVTAWRRRVGTNA